MGENGMDIKAESKVKWKAKPLEKNLIKLNIARKLQTATKIHQSKIQDWLVARDKEPLCLGEKSYGLKETNQSSSQLLPPNPLSEVLARVKGTGTQQLRMCTIQYHYNAGNCWAIHVKGLWVSKSDERNLLHFLIKRVKRIHKLCSDFKHHGNTNVSRQTCYVLTSEHVGFYS